MLCELCQNHDATVHLTQVLEGAVKKMHLCEACAKESGVDLQNPVSIADLLLGLGVAPKGAPEGPGRTCPRCHLRQEDFKKTGRLGCPSCYETFAAELAPLLKAMHRRDQHVGKIPQGQVARIQTTVELARLQQELEEAVAREDFEQAARLRDRLQNLRRGPEGGGERTGA